MYDVSIIFKTPLQLNQFRHMVLLVHKDLVVDPPDRAGDVVAIPAGFCLTPRTRYV